jgi:predicted  nucleic acid-binding Zn-ribbon protein
MTMTTANHKRQIGALRAHLTRRVKALATAKAPARRSRLQAEIESFKHKIGSAEIALRDATEQPTPGNGVRPLTQYELSTHEADILDCVRSIDSLQEKLTEARGRLAVLLAGDLA